MPKRMMNSYLLKKRFKGFIIALVRYIFIIGICFIVLYPLLIKISLAFMAEQDLYDPTVNYIPKNFTLLNIKRVMDYMNYWPSFAQTLVISLSSALLQMMSCILTGYGLARYQFRGNKLVFFLVLLTLVVPPQTLYVPLYLQYRTLGLIDNIAPFLILSGTCMGLKNGLYIYITRQFFKNMPKELEESAFIDGAGTATTFFRIMLPGASAAMLVIFVLSFVWQWTDVFYSSMFLNKINVLSKELVGLGYFLIRQIYTGSGSGISMAYQGILDATGLLLMIAPLIIVYVFIQRRFIESVERTGIVG